MHQEQKKLEDERSEDGMESVNTAQVVHSLIPRRCSVPNCVYGH